MPLLISLLEAIIARASTSAAALAIQRIIMAATRYWARAGYIERRIAKWVVGILSGVAAGASEALEEGYDEIKQAVLKWLSELIGEDIYEFTKEEFFRAIGTRAATEINARLDAKYGIQSPVTNLAQETVPEELGLWFAELINERLSNLLNKEVEIVSTIFPIDNVPIEIDAFLASELNLKLGTNITSVLFNNSLLDEIKVAVVARLETEITAQLARAKGVAIDKIIAKTIPQADKQDLINTYSDVLDGLLASLNFFELIGINTNVLSSYRKNKIRIHNRARQRKYRLTHVEQRVWVERA